MTRPLDQLRIMSEKRGGPEGESQESKKPKRGPESGEDSPSLPQGSGQDKPSSEEQQKVKERSEETKNKAKNIPKGLGTYKIVNDPIHGHFEIHPLCLKIIDTPQFQRLRYLKQMGATYLVYPGASHNRFEHSLGVYYLAGEFASMLKKRQEDFDISDSDNSDFKISDKDILCVQIAGLCHDLGHGPFSHMFDKKFLPLVRPDEKIKHEDLSVKMFDHLVESNNLFHEFRNYDINDDDLNFIKEQIAGPQEESGEYKGRNQEKKFLYEIVSNKRNGIDVDKWDYFARDCYMLGIKNSFDHTRCMKYARVLSVESNGNAERQICFRDKEVWNLYEMFHMRHTLHRIACQHRVGNIIEAMITEAMLKANHHIQKRGKNKKLWKISDTVQDMEAYQQLTDDIFNEILWSTEPSLAESKKILMNIQTRKLYKCFGQAVPPKNQTVQSGQGQIKAQFVAILKEMNSPLTEKDIDIDLVFMDYGMEDKNPIDSVTFYNKKDHNKPIKVSKFKVSPMLPETFEEQIVRFICKKRDYVSISQATQAFQTWADQHKFSVVGDLMGDMTPV